LSVVDELDPKKVDRTATRDRDLRKPSSGNQCITAENHLNGFTAETSAISIEVRHPASMIGLPTANHDLSHE
jgi:hypothetical protein